MTSVPWPLSDDEEPLPPELVCLQSGDGLSVVTLRGRVVYWNDASVELLKVPRGRAVGSHLADIARTRETWEAIWGHHITTVGAHLSGNPPVRRRLVTRDNENMPVAVRVSSMLLELRDRPPLIVYTYTVEPLPGDIPAEHVVPLGLTAREWEVACLLMSGLGTSEIASALSIAYATVRSHIRHILVALDANTRTQALMRLWSRFGTPDSTTQPGLAAPSQWQRSGMSPRPPR